MGSSCFLDFLNIKPGKATRGGIMNTSVGVKTHWNGNLEK